MKRVTMKFSLILCAFASSLLLSAEVKLDKHYFRPGEVFPLSIAQKTAPVSVRDFYGNSRRIDPVSPLLPTDRNGYFELFEGEREIGSYAVIPEPPSRDTEKNPFGVNFHLLRESHRDAARELELAKFIGIDWGRGMLPSFSAMRSPDFAAGFRRYQILLTLVKKSGIHPLVTITDFPVYVYGKKWNRRQSLTAPEDLSCVTDFCRAAAKAMPFVRHWEIGSETDTESFWFGRKSSGGDDRKIIGDYVDMLAAAWKGFRGTDVKILYSGVTSIKEGMSYRPFLTTTMELGAWKYYNIMSAHYQSDIPYIRSVMKKFHAPEVPIWITEIGKSAYLKEKRTLSPRSQVIADITQQVGQISDGAAKVFKYNFRNKRASTGLFEANFGLINRDFTPKPNYVAEATMIRLLANASFAGPVNVMKRASAGYLKAFRFRDATSGKDIFVVWLNDAREADVAIPAGGKELVLTDIMGGSRKLKVKKGTAAWKADDLPFFLSGDLIPDPGKPEYPEIRLLKTYEIDLPNPGFEDAGLSGWVDRKRLAGDIGDSPSVRVAQSRDEAFSGNGSLFAEVVSPPGHYVPILSRRIDLAAIRKEMTPNDRLIVKAECMMKRENTGRGSSFEISFLDEKGRRFKWITNGYRHGSTPWVKQQNAPYELPPATRKLVVGGYVAPDMLGKVYVDDVKLKLELWGYPRLSGKSPNPDRAKSKMK